ncbi:uncharacterized protein [Anabrus simplex]|uniref:uncharacterized protein n=1 Tax=Anabrus simplex TaxID=316456 RepID=UPI0035A282C7
MEGMTDRTTWRMLVVAVMLLGVSIPTSQLDFKMKRYENIAGVYFDYQGEVQLYTVEWKLVTYINLTRLADLFVIARRNLQKTKTLCIQIEKEVHIKCEHEIMLVEQQFQRIQGIKDLIRKITRIETPEGNGKRSKRGLINAIGTIAKTLFGTLDDSDAMYYEGKIKELEQEQLSMIQVAKSQMLVVKSTLQSVNNTLYDITANELKLSENFEQLKSYIQNETTGINEAFRQSEMQISLNKHLIELQGFLMQLHEHYQILLDSIVSSQTGTVSVQVLSPDDLVRAYKKAQRDFPKGYDLPYDLQVTYGYLILKISSVSVYITRDTLVYILRTPLTNKIKYNLYHCIPFPSPMKSNPNHFVYISNEKQYVLVDQERQTYVELSDEQVKQCKWTDNGQRLCKAIFPINNVMSKGSCIVKLLTGVSFIPEDCKKSVMSIYELLWIPIDDNMYIFVSPHETKVTSVCQDITSDISLNGVGIIQFTDLCTVYSPTSKIQSAGSVNTTTRKDLVPEVMLIYDCCEQLDSEIKLEDVPELNRVTVGSLLNHISDLRLASHKTEDVEALVMQKEKEFKMQMTQQYTSVYQIVTGVDL